MSHPATLARQVRGEILGAAIDMQGADPARIALRTNPTYYIKESIPTISPPIITTRTSDSWPGPAIIITALRFASYFLSKIGIKKAGKIEHQRHIELIEKLNNQVRNKRIDVMLILFGITIVFLALMYAYSVFIEQPKKD